MNDSVALLIFKSWASEQSFFIWLFTAVLCITKRGRCGQTNAIQGHQGGGKSAAPVLTPDVV